MQLLKRVGYLNLLLVMFPVALVLDALKFSPVWVFIACCLSVIPLAGLMGRSTEVLANRVGPGLGGLLNATFGNAAELIIAVFALRQGLTEVVKASITGSILGNILLVLGASFFAGGLKFQRQTFNPVAAGISSTLLLLAAMGLVVPAVFHLQLQFPAQASREEAISIEISVVLFVAYVLLLLFSLRTHKHLYAGEPAAADAKPEAIGHHAGHEEAHEDWPLWLAITVLCVATALIAVISERLVGTIEATRAALGLTEIFVGVIVIAIVGNAAEHSTAVLVAMKNRMDLSFQIAVGSGVQVALFVAPVLVFISLLPGFPRRLDLVFTLLEVVAILASVMAIGLVANDGESNWLEGALLLAVYVIIAIAFYNLPEAHTPVKEALRSIPGQVAGVPWLSAAPG